MHQQEKDVLTKLNRKKGDDSRISLRKKASETEKLRTGTEREKT